MCRLSSLTVHCLCLAVSLGVLACVLFGLGTACLSLTDHGFCPHELVVTVISVAGVFVVLAAAFAAVFMRYRHRLVKGDGSSTETAALTSKPTDISAWEMTQPPGGPEDSGSTEADKSSRAVSYWIEQQAEVSCNEVFPDDLDDQEPEFPADSSSLTETKM